MVEIAKALSHDLRLLILDEPTAAMTESDRHFQIVCDLGDDGVSILYISHRLAEVFALADSILVMGDGQVTAEQPTSTLTEDELMTLMVGRELSVERVQQPKGTRPGRSGWQYAGSLPRPVSGTSTCRYGRERSSVSQVSSVRAEPSSARQSSDLTQPSTARSKSTAAQ